MKLQQYMDKIDRFFTVLDAMVDEMEREVEQAKKLHEHDNEEAECCFKCSFKKSVLDYLNADENAVKERRGNSHSSSSPI